MFSGRKFHFRPVLTISVLLGLAILFSLGNWQLQRRAWKLDLIEKVETRLDAEPIDFSDAVARAEAGEDMDYTPVKLVGVWQPNKEAKVFGSYEGAAGVYLFAPVRAVGGDHVYVNLGYLPQALTKASNHAPLYLTLDETQITGLFRSVENLAPPASWFRSPDKTQDGLWFIRNPTIFAEDAGLNTSPYYIDSFARKGYEWPKGGTTRVEFRNNHLDYALTWFGLGAVLMVIWLIFSLPKQK